MTTVTFQRTRPPRRRTVLEAIKYPSQCTAELCRRELPDFIRTFWDTVSQDELKWNWHIGYLCGHLMELAFRVARGEQKLHDLIINVPPGSTKSITCSIMFPVWCWTNWSWMRFICGSYGADLSLDLADKSRELIRSDKFRRYFPNYKIKEDQDQKSNFRIAVIQPDGSVKLGGNRFSTSVGGSVTGFHGHILIVDDPLDPRKAVSEVELRNANHWMEQTLSTRKVDKGITPTVLIMQRLHQDDPTGHWLGKDKGNVQHICLPGEIRNYRDRVRPIEKILEYRDDLLDPVRMPWRVLEEMESDLGQYGYAGQVGQNPTPPAGGMFKVDHFHMVDRLPAEVNWEAQIRYWDKAGSKDTGAYTVGVKMLRLKSKKLIVVDCKRGRWATEERESIIRGMAEADGPNVIIYHEQEPGSGGKDSAEATTRNLLGFAAYADRPTGDKVSRADPYSVAVNNGLVMLLRGDWNREFIEEHRYFPFSTYKDQVDAASGAFTKLTRRKMVERIV